MSAPPAVETIDLVKRFGETLAVDGVSFAVRAFRARSQD